MIVYLYPVILLLGKIYKEITKEVLNFFFKPRCYGSVIYNKICKQLNHFG